MMVIRLGILISLLPLVFDGVSATGSTTTLTDNGFPINFLEKLVSSPIVQRKLKSRWKWEVWDVVPGTHAYQIYLFNVTNPKDVEKGLKPILQQVGPYYYKEKRVKFDVSVNLDFTVNYERNYTYTFDPSKSKGSEDDLINTINLPFVAFSKVASEVDGRSANDAVNALVSKGESWISQGVRVRDVLLNGFDVSKYQPYLSLLGNDTKYQDFVQEFTKGRYGVFTLANGRHEHSFVVESGLITADGVGKIKYWNDLTKLNWWNGDRCNMINGTDGSAFSPHLGKNVILQVFDLDVCRSVDFAFSGPIKFKNSVQGWTFNIANNTFLDPSTYAPNACFCKKLGQCLKSGALDVSACHSEAPFVMSFAHFLSADPEYMQAVSGLHPDPDRHLTQVDVEPVTGAVINYRKRFQWNIWVNHYPQIDYFQGIKPIVFPILWNDDVFHLNPDKAELLIEELAMQLGGGGDTASDLLNRLSDANHGVRITAFANLGQITLLFVVISAILTFAS